MSHFHQDILRSPLNNSKAKYHYSFSKATRFPKQSSFCQQAYYNVNSKLNPLGTKMGKGERSDFTRTTSVAPAPSVYNFMSDFDVNSQKSKGQTFGQSRDKIIQTSYIQKNLQQVPGAGQYDLALKELSSIAFTIRAKTIDRWLPNFLVKDKKWNEPGPANYTCGDSNIGQDHCTNAKYRSVSNNLISRQKRFQNKGPYSPGPCQYTNPEVLSDRGFYRLSKYGGQGKRLIGREQRKSFIDSIQQRNRDQPGPGQYSFMSEFGGQDHDFNDFQRTSTATNRRPITK